MLQVLKALPEHLLLPVLMQVPLPHTLSHLPSTCHPIALRSHHPSIDAHLSFHIPVLPPHLLPTALAATATLNRLEHLSLAATTLPHACDACMHPLALLPALTALDLSNTGFGSVAGAALAGVLPAMRQLESLDLSENRITAECVRALAHALSSCTLLRSLSIARICVCRPGNGPVLSTLVCAMAPLRLLTALRVGINHHEASTNTYHCGRQAFESTTDDVQVLWHSIRRLTHLKILEVDIPCVGFSEGRVAAMADALACVKQLQHLHLSLPLVDSANVFTPQHVLLQHEIDPGRSHALSRAVGCCAQLTELQLRIPDIEGAGAQDLMRRVAALPALRALRMLVERSTAAMSVANAACALADVLPGMAQLTCLRLLDEGRPLPVHVQQGLRATPAVRVAEAAAAAPQLRELRLEIQVQDGSMVELARVLCAATQIRVLRVTLTARFMHVTAQAVRELQEASAMFPHTEAIDVRYWCGLARFQPIVTAAAALNHIRCLTVGDYSDPTTRLATDVQAMLDCIPRMTALQQLTCELNQSYRFRARDPGRPLNLRPFCDGLSGLTGLTSLVWICNGPDQGYYQEQVLQGCSALERLAVLKLGELQAVAIPQFEAVLPRLPLRKVELTGASKVALVAVANVMRQLPHLRVVAVRLASARQWGQVVQDAAMALPACVVEVSR